MPDEKTWERYHRELGQELITHSIHHLSALTSDACMEHEELLKWLAIMQIAFNAWFQLAYYRTDRRKLRTLGPNSWAIVPIKFDDEVHDWPERQIWEHGSSTLGDWRKTIAKSNYFHCWQRLCFRLKIIKGRAQRIHDLALMPLAMLHGLDEQLVSRILEYIVVNEGEEPA